MTSLESPTPSLDDWQPWRPTQVAELLAGCSVPWCVAAGWAIDLHLGWQSREHEDVEIAIPRSHFPALRPYLAGFDLYDAGGGEVRRLGPQDEPRPDVHQVWLRDPSVPAWRMDIFLEPGDERTWVSHRDARITVPLAEAIARNAVGIPYLRPEIVLFTKAKHARDKDDADLALVWPGLDEAARAWTLQAIELAHPAHRWLAL